MSQTPQTGDNLTLDADNSKYLKRVLRRAPGDPVEVFTGDGMNYRGSISSIESGVSISIIDRQPNPSESALQITLVQSLAKGAKLDLVVQKATELGVHAIVPISNDRSVLQIAADKQTRKLEHWHKIAISACAQSNRSTVPHIHAPLAFESWLHATRSDPTFLLDPEASYSLPQRAPVAMAQCTLVIGPEGGFSPAELALAEKHRLLSARFGPRILRTETAGLAAIAALQALYGDLCQPSKATGRAP